jgi:FkbM family methyltransferase
MILSTGIRYLANWTRNARRVMAYRIYRWPQFSEVESAPSYSAFGEDVVALAWLTGAGIKSSDIRYLDVGASDPAVLSNTMLMYRRGARGVLVEPEAEMAQKLAARRPHDVVINAGVAFDDRRSAQLIRLTSSVFNTFSEKQAEHVAASSVEWGSLQAIVGRSEVRLIPINDIIKQNLGGVAPHFLSIDAESVDFEILQSLDLDQFRPWIICIEKSHSGAELSAYLLPRGYRVICDTPHNIMFMLDPCPAPRSLSGAGVDTA